MKFVRFGGGKTGLVAKTTGLHVVEVIASLPGLRAHDAAAAQAVLSVLAAEGPQDWSEMIGQWDTVRPAFQALLALAKADGPREGLVLHPWAGLTLEAPLPSPTVHIFSFTSNTVVHIQRAFKAMLNTDLSEDEVLKSRRAGLPPGGFSIWPASVIGPGATITPPRGARLLDYEGECAVILKKGGRDLQSVELWGYMNWNDLGVRDTHLKLKPEAPWAPFSLNLPKNFDTGNACGPWVVVDEDHDLRRLRCIVRVNGEVRQDWNLADMIYPFEDMFTHVSQWATLRPGDIVTSGTGAGVAIEGGLHSPHWLKRGDVVDVQLEGAGTLSNPIGDW